MVWWLWGRIGWLVMARSICMSDALGHWQHLVGGTHGLGQCTRNQQPAFDGHLMALAWAWRLGLGKHQAKIQGG
jgi:hypothetical protein